MKTGTTTHYVLCRFRDRPDAACRQHRCASCGRRAVPSTFGKVTVCDRCQKRADAVKSQAVPNDR